MFDLDKTKSAEKQAKKLKEITAKFDRLEKLFDNLLKEHDVSAEEISAFFNNANNFHDWAWEAMQKARTEMNHKLERDLKNIKNTNATAEKYQTLKQAGQWMFVR